MDEMIKISYFCSIAKLTKLNLPPPKKNYQPYGIPHVQLINMATIAHNNTSRGKYSYHSDVWMEYTGLLLQHDLELFRITFHLFRVALTYLCMKGNKTRLYNYTMFTMRFIFHIQAHSRNKCNS